jgi:hypothetical protein
MSIVLEWFDRRFSADETSDGDFIPFDAVILADSGVGAPLAQVGTAQQRSW